MIKIIKQGIPNRIIKTIYEHECIICGCVFEYEYKDLEYSICNVDFCIQCPCCNNHLGIILKDEKSRIEEIENKDE